MTREEYLKELNKAFGDFKFFADDHHYEYKGKRVGISVTRFYALYENEFNAQEQAEKSAIKSGKSVDEILREWEYKKNLSCDKGTSTHEFVQSLFSGAEYKELYFDGSQKYFEALRKCKVEAYNFYRDYKDLYEHLADEYTIGSEEYDIASNIDHLFINKNTGGLVLIDYKTNTDIYKKERYSKYMKVPLSHLKDTDLNHYALQLSIYRYIVEKYTDLKFEDMFIVWFTEENENYKILEIPYLKDEVERILESRKEKIMGKCMPILIIGKSGSGKSTSLRNLKKEDFSLVNVLNKELPFKNGRDIKGLASKDYEEIKNFIAKTPKNIVIIDDFGYVMTDKFVKKATEAGYTKFSVIAQEVYNFIEWIKNLDGDKRVYLMMHEEKNEVGDISPKTCGKMLDNQICIEGLFSILLRCVFDGKEHRFKTATDGLDVCKTPIDMFETEYIDNDLKLVDDTICEYYGIKKEDKKEEEK